MFCMHACFLNQGVSEVENKHLILFSVLHANGPTGHWTPKVCNREQSVHLGVSEKDLRRCLVIGREDKTKRKLE